MSDPVSPYLQRPLRSLDDALRDLTPPTASPEPGPAAPPPGAAAATSPAAPPPPGDSVTIGGQPVAIPAGSPPVPPAAGRIDLTA